LRRVNTKSLFWLFLSAALIVLDQFSKYWISAELPTGGRITVIEDIFYITYTTNTGAAWGLFSEHTEYLAIFSIISTLVLVYILMLMRRRFASLSLAMVIGGAIGNAIDRIRVGSVIDFIDVNLFGYNDFPIFNVADCAITAGVSLLVIYVLFVHREM
jgi:signal peptidase II